MDELVHPPVTYRYTGIFFYVFEIIYVKRCFVSLLASDNERCDTIRVVERSDTTHYLDIYLSKSV
jgi:hypothetical protein